MKQFAPYNKDAYKADHRSQYPENTQVIYSNLTARSGSRSNIPNGKGIIFVGLQRFIIDYLINEWNESFFSKPLEEVALKYQRRITKMLNLQSFDVSHLKELHDLGYLPLQIKALPEGSFVPYRVAMLTIQNTDDRFAWLTNMIESVMSCEMWGVINSATTYREFMRVFYEYSELTGSDVNMVPYQAHDFSMRGMFGRHAAAASAMAAIIIGSKGTDTIHGVDYAEEYYGKLDSFGNLDEDFEYAGSIPATEHSVMCAGGKENEYETYERLLTKVYPTGNVSIVSDTWDFWNVIDNYLPKLKPIIETRGGRTVIRPDSGDPVKIICGSIKEEWHDLDKIDPFKYCRNNVDIEKLVGENIDNSNMFFCVNDEDSYCNEDDPTLEEHSYLVQWKDQWWKLAIDVRFRIYNSTEYGSNWYYRKTFEEVVYVKLNPYIRTSTEKGLIESLYDIFGGTINEKGFKVLSPCIGAIYGDSISLARQKEILENLYKKGFSIDGLFLGVGSYSYQYTTRDTHGMAVKSTWAMIDGKGNDIFKDPITDDGTKKSAKGLLQVYKDDNDKYFMKDQCDLDDESGELVGIFRNGQLLRRTDVDKIRKLVYHDLLTGKR